MVILWNFGLILATPFKAKAVDFNFTGSHFTASSDGTLIHTYTVNGTQKTQSYSGQISDVGASVYKNGLSFFVLGAPLYIYEMSGNQTHENWGINCRQNANIQPDTSKYFLVVSKRDDQYQTEGIFFKQQCTNVPACGNAVTNILGEVYYFQTLDFNRGTGDDCRDVYDTNSEFYKYLEYVNHYPFAVDGLASGGTSEECSISGQIQVDFSPQNLTGDETGIVQWQDLEFESSGYRLEYRAQLWYKGPGAATFISAEETTVIQNDGIFTFATQERPTGQYVATATIKRNQDGGFEPARIEAVENQELNLIDPSFYPTFSDPDTRMEYFFGKSPVIDLQEDCSNFTGKDMTLASIGIMEEMGTYYEGETCGVTGNWITESIAMVLCAFIEGLAALSGWLTTTIFQGVFNA